MTSESQRVACLERAGYNVANLDPADVEIDLISDVPHRILFERAGGELRDPPLQELLAAAYGPARYVPFVKGRSAEYALVAACAENRPPRVLTHGLFRSTERQLSRHHAQVELVPRKGERTCNPDVDALAARLAAGGIDMVYLEPANNGWGGWPLELDAVRAVRRACDRNGALLILDATRVFGNCAAQGTPAGALGSAVRDITAAAHGFTVSCAKELLVPISGFVAVPDLERQRRAYFEGLINGTLLESLEARCDLAQGLEHVMRHPEELVLRRDRLVALADGLRALGVDCLDPPGAHAVFVVMDAVVTSGLQPRALEALLYRLGGVRAQIAQFPLVQHQLLRLALPLRSYTAEQLARVPAAIRSMIDRASEAPRLAPLPGGDHVHDMVARYAADVLA